MYCKVYRSVQYMVSRSEDCMFPFRCSGIEHFLLALAPTLPDLELVVNTRDWPQTHRHSHQPLPVFSFSKTRDNYVSGEGSGTLINVLLAGHHVPGVGVLVRGPGHLPLPLRPGEMGPTQGESRTGRQGHSLAAEEGGGHVPRQPDLR